MPHETILCIFHIQSSASHHQDIGIRSKLVLCLGYRHPSALELRTNEMGKLFPCQYAFSKMFSIDSAQNRA